MRLIGATKVKHADDVQWELHEGSVSQPVPAASGKCATWTAPARTDARPTTVGLLHIRPVVNKRALGIAVAILLFTGLVTLQVVQTAGPRASQVATLPDGSTLRLEQVSYGLNHYRPGAWWHSLARRLPLAWQSRLKVDTGASMTTSEPSLGVWLAWEKAGSSGSGWWDFGLVDEHGAEVPASSRSTRTGQPDALGYAFTAFPRRGRTMTLRLYKRKSGGERELAAAFEFANPVRGKFPEWRPQPRPAVVKQGDLEISFKRLLVGVNHDSKPVAPRPGEETWALAEFDVKANGVPSDVWFPDGIELADATGNKVRQNSWSSGVRGGAAHLRWQPYLWPSEAAWKIRVEFMRNHEQAVFSTNELVVVTGLKLPTVDDVTELNLSTNRLGHTVRVLGLSSGKGKFGTRHSSMSSTGVRIEVDGSPELGTDKRLTVSSVRDDQGRKVDSHGFGRGGGSYSLGFEPKPDAKSLDFTLVVQEVVTAEFLVKPEQFTPAKAASGK